MTRITGIGGVFIRAKDPDAMAAWYLEHLGVGSTAAPAAPWAQEAGPTVFAPFPADTDYFPKDCAFMLNFRVTDLPELIVRLEAAGVAVETREEWDSEIGRFARIHDPEGNPIELWQPPG